MSSTPEVIASEVLTARVYEILAPEPGPFGLKMGQQCPDQLGDMNCCWFSGNKFVGKGDLPIADMVKIQHGINPGEIFTTVSTVNRLWNRKENLTFEEILRVCGYVITSTAIYSICKTQYLADELTLELGELFKPVVFISRDYLLAHISEITSTSH